MISQNKRKLDDLATYLRCPPIRQENASFYLRLLYGQHKKTKHNLPLDSKKKKKKFQSGGAKQERKKKYSEAIRSFRSKVKF